MLPGKKYTANDAIRIMRMRAWLLVIPLILCVFGSLLVSRRLPDLFQSDTLIQVVPQRIPEEYVRSTVTARVEDRLNSLRDVIMSRTKLEQIVRDFNLYPQMRDKLPMQDLVDALHSAVIVDLAGSGRSGRSRNEVDAFRVRFTYSDPQVAQKVTARLGALFVEENARDRGALAEATDDFLQAQLAEARTKLEAQEQKLKAFRERHAGRLPTQLQANMQASQNWQQQLQQLTDAIARDRDRKLMLEGIHNDLRTEVENMARAVPAQPDTPANATALASAPPEQRLAVMRAALVRAEERLTSTHPDVTRLKRTIADLEKEVADSGASGSTASSARTMSDEEMSRRDRLRQMGAEIESLTRQVAFKESEAKRYRSQISEYQSRIDSVPGLESEWIALTRDYDTLQASYREMLAKSENAKVANNLEQRQGGEQFKTLDAARAPERPISPNRFQITGVGLLVGLALGLALVALLEVRDTSFRTEADIVSLLNMPVVAQVPYLLTSTEKRHAQQRRNLIRLGSACAFVLGAAVFWYLQLWKYAL